MLWTAYCIIVAVVCRGLFRNMRMGGGAVDCVVCGVPVRLNPIMKGVQRVFGGHGASGVLWYSNRTLSPKGVPYLVTVACEICDLFYLCRYFFIRLFA
jgi:hypothetical protein